MQPIRSIGFPAVAGRCERERLEEERKEREKAEEKLAVATTQLRDQETQRQQYVSLVVYTVEPLSIREIRTPL